MKFGGCSFPFHPVHHHLLKTEYFCSKPSDTIQQLLSGILYFVNTSVHTINEKEFLIHVGRFFVLVSGIQNCTMLPTGNWSKDFISKCKCCHRLYKGYW